MIIAGRFAFGLIARLFCLCSCFGPRFFCRRINIGFTSPDKPIFKDNYLIFFMFFNIIFINFK